MPSSDDEELERRRQVLEVEQRQVVVVAVLEDEGEDRRLRVVEVEDLAEQQRPERMDGRPDLGAELPRQRQELDRMTRRHERPVERRHPLDDLGVRRIARPGKSRQVALDVGHEDRHACLRQLAGQELESLGLAGPGRAGDEAVAVEHGQGDLHARVVGHLAIEHRAADDEARLGQRVGRRHRVVERLVHGSSEGIARCRWGGWQAYHRPPEPTRSPPHGRTGDEDRRDRGYRRNPGRQARRGRRHDDGRPSAVGRQRRPAGSRWRTPRASAPS